MVERNTRAEDVNKCKPLMLDRLLHQLHHMLALTAVATSHKSRSVHDGRRDGIDGKLHAAKGRTLGFHVLGAGGRNLSGGETINLVVHDDIGQVYVAARRVHKVVPTNAVSIAVSTRCNNGELVIRHLGTSGHGQGPAMKSVHPIGVDVPGKIGGTANSADGQDLMGQEPQLRTGFLKALQDSKVATARTPVRFHWSLKILRLQ